MQSEHVQEGECADHGTEAEGFFAEYRMPNQSPFETAAGI